MEIRQWVEDNPRRINGVDSDGETLLRTAACVKNDVALIKWLVNEKGADVNGRSSVGLRPLSGASCPDVIMALLECGADPLTKTRTGCTPLIKCALSGYVDCVARLLEDPRVRAKINKPFKAGASLTALHCACVGSCDGDKLRIIRLLLGAGADPTVAAPSGDTPLDLVRQRSDANLAVALQIQETLARCFNSAVIVKARRLVVCGRGNVPMPSYLQRHCRLSLSGHLRSRKTEKKPTDCRRCWRLCWEWKVGQLVRAWTVARFVL